MCGSCPLIWVEFRVEQVFLKVAIFNVSGLAVSFKKQSEGVTFRLLLIIHTWMLVG